ncbi:MAG: hypothetical protein ACK5RG_01215, partial [Cyclobacteriaceae bacterium]
LQGSRSTYNYIIKTGGQFAAKNGGQFGAKSGGQFTAKKGGHITRNLHFTKIHFLPKAFKKAGNVCNTVLLIALYFILKLFCFRFCRH